MSIPVVIIDDQPEAIEDLLYLIKKHELPLNILATANSGKDGVVAILKYKPQLVFLDVVMPGMSGFEMLELLPVLDFHLIITTSVDKYAIQALRFSALDFLLKPIKPKELKTAIDRSIEKNIQPTRNQLELLATSLKEKNQPLNKIALTISDGVELIELENILYFESDGNYTTVHLKNGKSMVVSKQLGKFEEIVDNSMFFRVHNSFLVNLNCIKKYIRSDGGYIILENEKSITIARNRKQAFLEYLGKI